MSARRPNRREVAAAETRREILRAARRLFAEHGYASTSVQQVAEESGVAVQTIYSSVGSKAALVLALNDLIDEEADIGKLAAEISEGPDPPRLIAQAVHPPSPKPLLPSPTECADTSTALEGWPSG